MKTAAETLLLAKDARIAELLKLINDRANKGFYDVCTTNRWESLLILEFTDLLKSYGYEVRREGKAITISWEAI